jgi:hypothetical protein
LRKTGNRYHNQREQDGPDQTMKDLTQAVSLAD